jgi:hypothetical protein
VELRAWPTDTWAKLSVDPQAAADAVIAAWRRGLNGLKLGGLIGEEAIALERPTMTSMREQLRQRLGQQVQQAWWRWLHPPADVGSRPLPVAADTRRPQKYPRQTSTERRSRPRGSCSSARREARAQPMSADSAAAWASRKSMLPSSWGSAQASA